MSHSPAPSMPENHRGMYRKLSDEGAHDCFTPPEPGGAVHSVWRGGGEAHELAQGLTARVPAENEIMGPLPLSKTNHAAF